MTEISASLVKQLRDATSAGMMDCKRALVETDGDFDEAVKLLRERGMASAAKRADRATSEGKVGVMVRDNVGAIVAIGCETEPVSNNEEFLAYCEKVMNTVFDGGDPSALEEERVNLTAKLGENIQVVGSKRMEAGDGEVLSSYVHSPANKVGASCARRAATPLRRGASRCTSRSHGRRTAPARRSLRSSSTRSARFSPTRRMCSRSPRTSARRSSKAS